LAIQDTTELNYTSHKALSGTGYLDSKYAKGLKMTMEVKRSATQTPRTATLKIRHTTITIAPPQNRPKTELLAPVKLQAILVTEVEPPLEIEPITWLLLTTLFCLENPKK